MGFKVQYRKAGDDKAHQESPQIPENQEAKTNVF